MKRTSFIFILLLAACATPEELKARKEAQMKADYDICVNDYGFKPQSDAARNCMLQIELAREQQRQRYYYDYDHTPRYHHWHYRYR